MDEIEKKLRALQKRFSDPSNSVYNVAKNGFVWSNLARSVSEEEDLDILFVGINPSLIGEKKEEYFSFNPQTFDKSKQYFKPFHKLIELVQDGNEPINWTMMDLLYLRQTKQKDVMNLLKKADGPDYFAKQLFVSMERLETLMPKLIVVCNTGAALFTGIEAREDRKGKQVDVWMGYKFSFDDDLGVYHIDEDMNDSEQRINSEVDKTDLVGTYVIFTSSLTYMSKYTKHTLIWQMKKVLNK